MLLVMIFMVFLISFCVNWAFRSRLTLRKECQVELWVETPKQLGAARFWWRPGEGAIHFFHCGVDSERRKIPRHETKRPLFNPFCLIHLLCSPAGTGSRGSAAGRWLSWVQHSRR